MASNAAHLSCEWLAPVGLEAAGQLLRRFTQLSSLDVRLCCPPPALIPLQLGHLQGLAISSEEYEQPDTSRCDWGCLAGAGQLTSLRLVGMQVGWQRCRSCWAGAAAVRA